MCVRVCVFGGVYFLYFAQTVLFVYERSISTTADVNWDINDVSFFSANAMLARAPCDRDRGFLSRDENNDGNSVGEEGQDSKEGHDNENLDGVHGQGRPTPEDPDTTRRWSSGRDSAAEVDWGMGNWSA